VIILRFVKLLGAGMPVQLLRQQIGRAYFDAGPAADAGHRRLFGRQLPDAGGEDAVGGLGHRHLIIVQGEAHHRPAHDQALDSLLITAALGDEVRERGAQQGVDVLRLGDPTGHGHDAGNHRLPDS
jgi:hypothetical protein